MKTRPRSQILTRRQTLSYLALGAASVVTTTAFASTSSDGSASTNTFSKQLVPLNGEAAPPLVISF